MTAEERQAFIAGALAELIDERCRKERAACAAIADAVLAEHLPASESPVDQIRNISQAQVGVARRIAEEIKARGATS
jgi:hypothetical protein